MKKSLLSIVMLALTYSAAAQDYLSNSELARQWRGKAITVKNTGQAANVVTLLEAFSKTWPVWSVSEVVKQALTPAPTTRTSGSASIYDDEDDYRILVDKKNGYVDLSSEADIEQMEACLWRKSDGHSIFAVKTFMWEDPIARHLCWYDYDPSTHKLTPEGSPLDEFEPSCAGSIVGFFLPQKGTDFTISEYYDVLDSPIKHIYHWDKLFFTSGVAQIPSFQFLPAVGSTHYSLLRPEGPWTHYALLDLTGEENPVFLLGQMEDGQFTRYIMLAQFKTDICQIGEVSPDGDEITVYQLPPSDDNKRVAVRHRDMAGGYWYHILSGDRVEFVVSDLPDFQNWKGGKGRIVSVEAGFGTDDENTDILKQLGQKINIGSKLIWHPFEVIEEEP